MARDGKHIAVRASLQCAGDNSGKVSNTWMFKWTGVATPLSLDWGALADLVIAFYNTGVSTGPALGALMGPQFPRTPNASEVALYDVDMADPNHYFGSPIWMKTFGLAGGAGGSALPNECCVVLSFRSAYGSDPEHAGPTRPRASDRGRVYLGPWGSSAVLGVTPPTGGVIATVTSAVRNAITGAYDRMVTDGRLANWDASVWSRKEAQFKSVTDYAMDDLWDTQRRRSAADPLHTWLLV